MWFLSMVLLWSSSALLSALLIVIDMRRLGASRVGVPANTWLWVALLAGPLALVVYLFKRRAVRQALMEGVWRLVGDGKHPLSVRYARLEALHRLGIVGPSLYSSCRRVLGQGSVIHRSEEEQHK